MKQKLLFLAFCSFIGADFCLAQNTLNVHQKDGAIVRYAFSEKPVVTYTDTGIHLVTTKVEVDYPLASLEMFSFEDDDAPEGVENITTCGSADDIHVYTTSGILVHTISHSEGTATFSIAELPAGIYIIKNGNITYKITKK